MTSQSKKLSRYKRTTALAHIADKQNNLLSRILEASGMEVHGKLPDGWEDRLVGIIREHRLLAEDRMRQDG